LKIVRDSATVNGIKTRDCGSDNEELRPKLLIRTYANLPEVDSLFLFRWTSIQERIESSNEQVVRFAHMHRVHPISLSRRFRSSEVHSKIVKSNKNYFMHNAYFLTHILMQQQFIHVKYV